MPAFSVVMPVRNGAPYLELAVRSVLEQTFADFEFIIIDDGSSDQTPAILSSLAKSDARICLLRTSGEGIVVALNEGIRAARGTIIARMDADDIAMPERFEMQVEALRAMPHLVAIGSCAITIDEKGRETGRMTVPTDASTAMAELMRSNSFIHPSMIFRREPAVDAGLYRPACIYAEDYDLWLRLSERGKMANLGQSLIRFRRHSLQTSKTKRLTQRAATAFARQMAIRRRKGEPEEIDMNLPLHAALGEFLRQRDRAGGIMERPECKDTEIILREVHRELDALLVKKLIGLMKSGLTKWERLRLRFRMAFAKTGAGAARIK